MAKGQARFVTEVAPSQLVSIMRRRKQVPRRLDPIAEDEREYQLAHGPEHHHHQHGLAAARTKRAPPLPQERERAGGLMREVISKYFSDAHGQGWSWEQISGSRQQGHR